MNLGDASLWSRRYSLPELLEAVTSSSASAPSIYESGPTSAGLYDPSAATPARGMTKVTPAPWLEIPESTRQYPYEEMPTAEQAGGGIDPGTAWNIYSQFAGQGGASAGASAGATSGSTAAGASAASGSSAGAASSGAAGGSSGGAGMMASAGPWVALAAAIIGHNEWAERKGLRDGEKFKGEYGLTGRALYKDKDYYAERADKLLPGLGDDINVGASMSSPVDLFRGDTWKGIGKSLASGGVVGGLLKKIF